MQPVILGTAGHIDHGKTQLIKALTGRNTDTMKEEKQRGITIDLGFTYFDLPNGERYMAVCYGLLADGIRSGRLEEGDCKNGKNACQKPQYQRTFPIAGGPGALAKGNRNGCGGNAFVRPYSCE